MIVSGRASHCVSKSVLQRRLYAGLSKSFGRINENESRRCFSTPAKVPAPQEAGQTQTKPDTTNKAPAGSPKVQPAAGASPKASNPQQAVQKPPLKPAQAQATGAAKPIVSPPKTQASQAAGPASQKVQAPASTVHKTQAPPPPPGQKAQVSQGGVKTVPPVTKVVPPTGQKVSQATSSLSQKPSKWKVLLASGAVGSVVLGLFYWQFPRIHDGPTDAGDKGKDASDTGFLPDQHNTDGKSAAEAGSSVAAVTDDTEKKEDVVNGVVEPDSAKVEAVPVESSASDRAEKSESKTGKISEQMNAPEVIEVVVPLEEIVVEVEPDSDEEVSITISKSEDEEAHISVSDDNVVVTIRERNADISEPVLIQRGHEDLVQRHDKGDLMASDGSAAPKNTGLDVVAAIHAAEQRQAEIDAMVFKEQLQFLQEKYKHELTDVERKASSYQEQIRRLREGMENQKVTHVSRLKKQQEEAESRFQDKLKHKDEETQRQLDEAELRAKAESAAAITEERASFLNDIGSVKVHMEAMNAALEAKSEEAREGHEIRQLSLGAFALEDALQNGAPIDKEVASLLKSAGGDPLVEVAITTLPKEVLEVGTLTPAELDRKLKEIKGALRELALLPPTGGGVLCHLIARLASSLKLPDHALYLDSGVDAVLSRVQASVESGKLFDAAEVLSLGLSGTNADKLAGEWATQARNRAVAEQACALLRAHAAALALRESEQAS